jgi:flagellar biosynthesis GTPase FlhF
MYVKKFEGENLTETLNLVKQELGPDAIILKTITNKGLKGAFKKSKIEITAAISEESYANKSRVDKVFSKEQKSDFYKSNASDISKSINSYNKTQPQPQAQAQAGSGYGNIGLNKVVKTVSKASNKIKNSLDDFLGAEDEVNDDVIEKAFIDDNLDHDYVIDAVSDLTEKDLGDIQSTSPQMDIELRNEIQVQKNKIKLLENKLERLIADVETKTLGQDEDVNIGLSELKTTLKTADLSDSLVQEIVREATFELSKEELNNKGLVFEFALQMLSDLINVDMPLFSKPEVDGAPVVTALVSDGAIGQSSMAIKLAVLNNGARVIKYRANEQESLKTDFAAKLFNIKYSVTSSLPTMLSEIRKSISNGESVILDIKTSGQDLDTSRKILETLKRSFEFIELLITTSAINAERYNRKIISKYKDFSDGVIISYVDQCMSFGSLLNTHYASLDLPLKFFGTGETIPDDIEAASAERILAAMFRL